MPVGIAPTAVVSYTPFSPLPLARRYIFCCTVHAEAFSAAGYDAACGRVTVSNRPDLCEFQCNGAMPAAKTEHKG